jgi:ABC-type glycerol-3-phosphate transport system substrate-binding protein
MILIVLLLCLIRLRIVWSLQLKALAFSRNADTQPYSPLIDQFNKYSNEQGLDITIKLNLLTSYNSTFSLSNFGTMIESLFKNKKNKYDLYFYDNLYTPRYGHYLLDLRELISKEVLNLYDKAIISKTCMYKDRLVGIPVQLSYSVLYSNHNLLKKYDKQIPTTWDELIETSKYILKKEQDANNTNIIAYNGLFDDSDQGTCSLIDFIYSCRKDSKSPYPKLISQTSIDALEMIKKLKNEIASDEIFSSDDYITASRLFDPEPTMIFTRFLIFQAPVKYLIPYTISALPGLHKGVTGASVCGFNIGISKMIDKVNKEAAFKVVKYIASKEVHREFVKQELTTPFMPSLLEEKEICDIIDCSMYRSLQYTGREITKDIHDVDAYSDKFRKYIYEFLYGNKGALEVLKKVEDITKIYTISIHTEDSLVGLIYFIIYVVISTFMVVSIIFIFKEDFSPFFTFLSNDFWVIIVIGLIEVLSIDFTRFGEITVEKCHLRLFMLCTGFTLVLIPNLYKLTINFPIENKISFWSYRHPYLFLSLFIFLDLSFSGLSMLAPYEIENVFVEEGQNFQLCRIGSIFGSIVIWGATLYKILIIGVMLVLIFSEWNIQSTFFDMKLILSVVYITTLLTIITSILKFIKIRNYIMYYLMETSIFIIFTVSNYFLLFGYRLVLAFMMKQNIKSEYINNVCKNFVSNKSMDQSNNNSSKTNSETYQTNAIDKSNEMSNTYNDQNMNDHKMSITPPAKIPIFTKIINCHYTITSGIYNNNNN